MCKLKLQRIFASTGAKIHPQKYDVKYCKKCQEIIKDPLDHNGLCYWCFAWQENPSLDTGARRQRRVIPFISDK